MEEPYDFSEDEKEEESVTSSVEEAEDPDLQSQQDDVESQYDVQSQDDEEDIQSVETQSQSQSNEEGNKGEDDEEEEEDYLQKFNRDINKNYILDFHPESVMHNEIEIAALTTIVRDKDSNIVDDLHRTIPFLTKYEKTRILGQRAKQINTGAKAFVKVPEHTIDGYLIAELELKQKRIPFIIRRPIPGGGVEYWNLKDLEVIDYAI